MIEVQAYFHSKLYIDKTMGGTRIEKYNCWLMEYRENTRHHWCTLGKFGESCEIHPPLTNLQDLPLALALVALVALARRLPWKWFPWYRTTLGEVRGTATVETTIVVASSVELRSIGP